MTEQSRDDLDRSLRERGARYVVDTQGQRLAVLLTVEEYEHYLDLLDDEADSQDAELVARLAQAAGQLAANVTPQGEREPWPRSL